MQVRFESKERIAEDIYSFYFSPDHPIRYTAGQFIELTLPIKHPDERGSRHWFTLSSSPSEPLLAITTKFSHPGSIFKQTLNKLSPDDHVTMSEPLGDFVLPKDPTVPLVFIAGGIGITPVRSIIKWLSDSGEKRKVTVIYLVSTKQQCAFMPLLTTSSLTLHTIIGTRPSPEELLKVASLAENGLLYVSGPEGMTESLTNAFKTLGVIENQLVTDFFPGYPID